ncbi:MAG: DUF4382 domain-containing protein [Bacteroidota bacterium]
MKKNLILTASVLSIVLLILSGCQETGGDSTGRLSIKVTDAPFPVDFIEEASVTITKVELRQDMESEENPFITVFEGSKEFNLLDLRNGVVEELVDVEIPAGSYNLMRIYVENAGIVVKEYGSYSVKVPSGSQTGIKMFIAPSLQVSGGLTAEVLLDFNLDKSFVLKGNLDSPSGIDGFNFKPVIRAVNNTTAGSIYGVVSDIDTLPIMGAAVSMTLDGVETIAQTGEKGVYTMLGVPAGSYSMTASKDGYTSLTVEEVVVVEGNKTVQDFELETAATTE